MTAGYQVVLSPNKRAGADPTRMTITMAAWLNLRAVYDMMGRTGGHEEIGRASCRERV